MIEITDVTTGEKYFAWITHETGEFLAPNAAQYGSKKNNPTIVKIRTVAKIYKSVDDAKENKNPISIGAAYKSPRDKFVRSIGRHIAIGRAFRQLGFHYRDNGKKSIWPREMHLSKREQEAIPAQ